MPSATTSRSGSEEVKETRRVKVAYSDNFRYDRRQPWTH